jgi:flagellar hook-basal body complex protein FliE
MSVPGIEAIEGLSGATGTAAAGFTPYVAPTVPSSAVTAGAGTAGVTGPAGPDFGKLVADGIEKLDGTQRSADALAVQAATGDLENLHDYTIAATQAQVTTQVTVAIRNKAVEAFTEIMRMQV